MIRALFLFCFLALAACSGDAGDADAEYRKDLSAAADRAKAKLSFFWEHFDAPEVD